MKTTGSTGMMVFEPAFIQTKIGDKIRFLPSDPGHNAEIIPGLLPAGVQPVGSELSNLSRRLAPAIKGVFQLLWNLFQDFRITAWLRQR
jgi:hypothetical protein